MLIVWFHTHTLPPIVTLKRESIAHVHGVTGSKIQEIPPALPLEYHDDPGILQQFAVVTVLGFTRQDLQVINLEGPFDVDNVRHHLHV